MVRLRQREAGRVWAPPPFVFVPPTSESSSQHHHRLNYHLSEAHADTVPDAFILFHIISFHAVVLVVTLSDRYSVT